ncbi:hypothetical protein CDL15_Pgr015690 [Punica granatum]|uniref:Uncharacterized protein n=1 Tax=Punica granatum TaxID=22663 RepID=A0A218XN19_PUNGR|nr:hypothetical protein CDL15_Pgr015690 [Punica granatum]
MNGRCYSAQKQRKQLTVGTRARSASETPRTIQKNQRETKEIWSSTGSGAVAASLGHRSMQQNANRSSTAANTAQTKQHDNATKSVRPESESEGGGELTAPPLLLLLL